MLCAAAAGSGKTAVLAARVVGRLDDPVAPLDIDRLLVMTFTRSAAAEMRRRIGSLLHAQRATSPRLARQIWRLPQADITTVHGFCERTVRRYFAEIGLDPSFSVLDAAESQTLLSEALEQVLEQHYAGAGLPAETAAAFASMVERYGGTRLDQRLGPLVLQLRAFARSMPDPDGWLATAAAPGIDWGLAREVSRRELRHCLARTLQAEARAPEAYLPALTNDRALLGQILVAIDGPWDLLAQRLQTAAFIRLPAAKGEYDRDAAADVRRLRDANRQALNALRQGPFARSQSELTAEADQVAADIRPLIALVGAVDRHYAARKQNLAALDFDDLEHRCLEVLRGPAGLTVRARYAEVLVDEAQDLSPVQDELLSRLVGSGGESSRPRPDGCRDCAAGGPPASTGASASSDASAAPTCSGEATLFTVGDVRQSIYGFRHAEPRRFAEREARYAQGGGQRIALPHNFRSRRPVLAAVNYLFTQLFAAEGAGLPELARDPLVYGAGYPPLPDGTDGAPVRIVLLDGDSEEENTALEREAAEVSRQVGEWLTCAWVCDGDALRRARPSDCAVLLRAPGRPGQAYVEALRRAGIPCWSPHEGERGRTVEGRTVLAWLQTLENPQQDIPLAATLLGPFGGFTASELAEVRTLAPEGSLWRSLRACALSRRAWRTARGPAAASDRPGRVPAGPTRSAVPAGPTGAAGRISPAAPCPHGPQALPKFGGGAETATPDALAGKALAFLHRLDAWRTAARQGSFTALLASAVEGTGYAAFVSGLPAGAERRANLDWCLDRCREADRFHRRTLSDLIRHLQQDGAGGETVADAAQNAGNAVRVMSVHGSKGLEFPLVIVAGLGRRFHGADTGDVIADRHAGVGARCIDLERRLRWPTLRHALVASRQAEAQRAEELRVLYVALTRAREGLCLVGTLRELAARAGGWALAAEARAGHPGAAPPDLSEGHCYAEWLLPVLAGHVDVAPVLGAYAGIPHAGGADPHGSHFDVRLLLGQSGAALAEVAATEPPAGTDVADGRPRTSSAAPRADGPGYAPAVGPVVGEGRTPSPPAITGRGPLPAPSAQAPGAGPTPPARRLSVPDPAGPDTSATSRSCEDVVSPASPTGPADVSDPSAPEPSALWVRLEAEAAWRYPWEALAATHAKVSVGELRDRAVAAGTGETAVSWAPGVDPAGGMGRRHPIDPASLARPRWLPGVPPTVTEIGAATHALLRHIALHRHWDLEGLASCRDQLVARGLLAAGPARAVDLPAVARFLAGPLGLRLRAHPDAVWREVPFAMRLPASEVQPHPPAADQEWVLVQGVIDALVLEDAGLLLLDYKTDGAGGRLARRYAPQLTLYARAATTAWDRPVAEAWLCFLATGEMVRTI